MRPVLSALRKARVPRVRTTELCQGMTLRWVVAWSFAAEASELAPGGERREGGREARLKTFSVATVGEAEVRARVLAFLDTCPAQEARATAGETAAAEAAEAAEVAEVAEAVEAAASSGAHDAADAADAAEGAAEAMAESVESVECLARGRLPCANAAAGVGSGAVTCGAGEGGAGGDTFVFEVRLVRSPPHTDGTGGAADAAGGGGEGGGGGGGGESGEGGEGGEGGGLSVQVHLCEGHGAAAASFWAWAERLRNDVVRDTRKWRRLAAREAKPNGPS